MAAQVRRERVLKTKLEELNQGRNQINNHVNQLTRTVQSWIDSQGRVGSYQDLSVQLESTIDLLCEVVDKVGKAAMSSASHMLKRGAKTPLPAATPTGDSKQNNMTVRARRERILKANLEELSQIRKHMDNHVNQLTRSVQSWIDSQGSVGSYQDLNVQLESTIDLLCEVVDNINMEPTPTTSLPSKRATRPTSPGLTSEEVLCRMDALENRGNALNDQVCSVDERVGLMEDTVKSLASHSEIQLTQCEERLTKSEKRQVQTEGRLNNVEGRVDKQLSQVEGRLSYAEEQLNKLREIPVQDETQLTNSELFTKADRRLTLAERQLTNSDKRLTQAAERLAKSEKRQTQTEERLTKTDGRLTKAEEQLTKAERQLTNLDKQLNQVAERLSEAGKRQIQADNQHILIKSKQETTKAELQLLLTEQRLAQTERQINGLNAGIKTLLTIAQGDAEGINDLWKIRHGFTASLPTGQRFLIHGGRNITCFSQVTKNQGGHYDSSTSTFTVPVSGWYKVELSHSQEDRSEIGGGGRLSLAVVRELRDADLDWESMRVVCETLSWDNGPYQRLSATAVDIVYLNAGNRLFVMSFTEDGSSRLVAPSTFSCEQLDIIFSKWGEKWRLFHLVSWSVTMCLLVYLCAF